MFQWIRGGEEEETRLVAALKLWQVRGKTVMAVQARPVLVFLPQFGYLHPTSSEGEEVQGSRLAGSKKAASARTCSLRLSSAALTGEALTWPVKKDADAFDF